MLLVIRDQPLRIISIVLLVYPLLMLAGTLGTMTEHFAHEESRERLAAYLDDLAEQFAEQKSEERK